MLVETNAIVISKIKYGASSLIAKCYCKELGLKSFFLKGILTSKKGGLKKSLFQPLNLITISTQIKIESNLSKVMRENSSGHPRESNNFEYSLYSARAPCNPPANLHSVPPAQEQKLEHLRLKVKNHN